MRIFLFLFAMCLIASFAFLLAGCEPTVVYNSKTGCARLSNQPEDVCAPMDRAARFSKAFGQEPEYEITDR